jgi:hypothetical protein
MSFEPERGAYGWRDLSTVELRRRLVQRGLDPDEVDELLRERDDEEVAQAITIAMERGAA